MRQVRFVVLAFGCLLLCAGARSQAPVVPMDHRSLAAYPNAVVSLKDGRTGMTFNVEINGRVLVALTSDGKDAWRVNVPDVGHLGPEAVIRNLRLDGGTLEVVCGKSDTFIVDTATGAVRYEGSD